MKKLLLILISLAFSSLLLAQDKITTYDGKVYEVKILEEDYASVKYYKTNDPDKKIRTLSKEYIKSIDKIEIPRQTNLIVITHDSLKDFDLFKQVIIYLKGKGFEFDEIDKDFYMATTKMRQYKRLSFDYNYSVSITDNKLLIRGYVVSKTNFSAYSGGLLINQSEQYERSANRSLKTSIWYAGFKKMLEFSNNYIHKYGGQITYEIEEYK